MEKIFFFNMAEKAAGLLKDAQKKSKKGFFNKHPD
jgi:hypothetical protein